MFDEMGSMAHFPSASQVLLRRVGYRDLLSLWQTFHHARRPLFEPLRQAMDVRDVATLYEMWAFFALTEEIAVLTDQSPVIDLRLSDERGLGGLTEACFGEAGKLVYNQYQPSYSVSLRPDFTWVRDGCPDVVLDAKFPPGTAIVGSPGRRRHTARDSQGAPTCTRCTRTAMHWACVRQWQFILEPSRCSTIVGKTC